MNLDFDFSVAEEVTSPVGYAEETLLLPPDLIEVHGQDGYGWYVDAEDAPVVVRLLNYDDTYERPQARNRGERGKVRVSPKRGTSDPGCLLGKRSSSSRYLLGARRSDFIGVGFEDTSPDVEAVEGPRF